MFKIIIIFNTLGWYFKEYSSGYFVRDYLPNEPIFVLILLKEKHALSSFKKDLEMDERRDDYMKYYWSYFCTK